MKASTAILLALFAVGVYLLYKSLANLGTSLVNLPSATANALGTAAGNTATAAYNTVSAEASSLYNSLFQPSSSLAGVGTASGVGGSLSSLFGDTTTFNPNLNIPDVSVGSGLSLGSSGNLSVPVSGGTLSFGNMPSLPSDDTVTAPLLDGNQSVIGSQTFTNDSLTDAVPDPGTIADGSDGGFGLALDPGTLGVNPFSF